MRRLKIGPFLQVNVAAAIAISSCLWWSARASADEGGVSFWVPGAYGSLAAVPLNPGWTFSTVYYFTSVSASGAIAAQRELQIGRFNPSASVNLNVNLKADANLGFIDPSYVFATPILGGQLQLEMLGLVGGNTTALNGTLTAMVGPLSVTRQGSISDSTLGVGDLYPKATLRWNKGVNNFMTYVTGDIPVGDYSSTSLANLGIGHGAVDGGAGYTYLNPATGHEFSAVTGLTYNLVNPSTDYQNGIDWHLDWGASQFLSKTTFVGAVGYFYDQLTADKGSAPFLGPIESRVIGVGPQLGIIIPMGAEQAYLNFKAYREFDNQDRPDGWNAWLTFSITSAPPAPTPQPVVAKY
jgi:hypothetical protein